MKTPIKIKKSVIDPQKRVIFQEGGRHAINQPLMVIESDRTSPMIRSVQSQQQMINILSRREDGLQIMENNRLVDDETSRRPPANDLETKTTVNLVPVSKSSREVKLLFSEYQQPKEKNKKLFAMIKEALKDHAVHDKNAKKIIEEDKKKRRLDSSSSDSKVSDNNSMESVFDKNIRMVKNIHTEIHKTLDSLKNSKNLNFNNRKLLE